MTEEDKTVTPLLWTPIDQAATLVDTNINNVVLHNDVYAERLRETFDAGDELVVKLDALRIG